MGNGGRHRLRVAVVREVIGACCDGRGSIAKPSPRDFTCPPTLGRQVRRRVHIHFGRYYLCKRKPCSRKGYGWNCVPVGSGDVVGASLGIAHAGRATTT